MLKSYLKRFILPSPDQEDQFIEKLTMTCYQGVYPYKIFPNKELRQLELAPITIFYGGNGSGKTTLLNLIGEKARVLRHTPFNASAFFRQYVDSCHLDGTAPRNSQILTSDDVFNYLLDVRCLNQGIDTRREELMEEFTQRKYAHHQLRSLAEYEDWKESSDAKSKSKSQFVRDRLMKNMEMQSNGESAMRYFVEHIEENTLYLLDEPENSLSIQRQQELSHFLCDSARFFGCQFILATHSPVLLAMEDALIYDLDEVPVQTKPWTELENVRKYFDFFMAHREEFSDK